MYLEFIKFFPFFTRRHSCQHRICKFIIRNLFRTWVKNNCVFIRWAITPNENTWLNVPCISKGERVFSTPLHANRKFSK